MQIFPFLFFARSQIKGTEIDVVISYTCGEHLNRCLLKAETKTKTQLKGPHEPIFFFFFNARNISSE